MIKIDKNHTYNHNKTLAQVSMLTLICYIFYRTHVPIAAVPVSNTPDDGCLRPKRYSDSAEIKTAQCCIKLVFHLTYTMMHGNRKLKCTL